MLQKRLFMKSKAHHFQTIGQKYNDFELTNITEIKELQSTLLELLHIPTGAQIIHIATDDPENLFCLSFKTLPDSSNGVAHILEHTVLCGSKKFPVKDPFFAMTRRSLNTFMNALTGSDFTCYPAATQVTKDFYNLLEVYIDACFHPNLNRLSFLQEGHRLEFASPEDPESLLEFKGIVLNEMKGALASSGARMSEAINQYLFPNITYGFNSGGDPNEIPLLTYEALKEFHQKYYHPSRCLFFFYGNLPLTDHLDFIAKYALQNVEKLPPLDPIPLQPRYRQPKFVECRYPISPGENTQNKTLISFAWLTCHILEQEELLALSILEIILLGNDASPLKMAFLKSGLCKQVTSFHEPEVNEIPFAITLKGCNPENAGHLEKILKNTLQNIIKKGISLELIENAMHLLEFYRSEISGDHGPFGLSLFMRSALLKQHGGKPQDGLMIHSLFDILHKRILRDPNYLSGLIQKYFLGNPHFVTIVMSPDKELEAKELVAERLMLDQIQANLTPAETKRIIDQAKELSIFQKRQEEESEDVLPKVTLDDVQPYPRNYELTQERAGNLEVFHHACFTNEIVYADLNFYLPDIEEKHLPYVRLFSTLIGQLGCGDRDYVENLNYIQAHTGGAGSYLNLNLQAQDFNQFHPSICIKGKALHRKANKLFPLLKELAESTDFADVPRLKEIILKHFTALESSLNQNALKYAINQSASSLSVASKIVNHWYGIEYYWKIKEIAQDFDKHASELVGIMISLQEHILCLESPHLVITCDAPTYDNLKKHEFYGLQNLETRPYTPWKGNYTLPTVQPQGRIIASPIAFIGSVFNTVSYVHPASPALSILACLFDNLILHPRIREQGGAYGGGAVSNAMSGNFYFYSYRDPHIAETLKTFVDAVEEISEGNFDDTDLEEAKLEMIQGMDSPVAPGSKGDVAYGWYSSGKTFKMREEYRHHLLSTNREDILKALKNEILPRIKDASTVVYASKELLERENTTLKAQGKEPLKILNI